MDYQVVWSPRALEDVVSIAAYIATDSPAYAAAIVKKIIGTTRDLNSFPFSGRMVPEFDDESMREKFVYSYRVIYRVRGEIVTVATVLHVRRQLDPDSSP